MEKSEIARRHAAGQNTIPAPTPVHVYDAQLSPISAICSLGRRAAPETTPSFVCRPQHHQDFAQGAFTNTLGHRTELVFHRPAVASAWGRMPGADGAQRPPSPARTSTARRIPAGAGRLAGMQLGCPARRRGETAAWGLPWGCLRWPSVRACWWRSLFRLCSLPRPLPHLRRRQRW